MKSIERTSKTSRRVAVTATLTATLVLGACASAPPAPPPKPQTPPPPIEVFFYPTRGQSAAQQDRDRYECYLWASKQSGFDPSSPQLAPHQRIEVKASPPPGTSTAMGAATGALLGAVVSPGHPAEGAAVGAVTGAVIGAGADAARQEQAAQVQGKIDQREAQRQERLEQQAASYRRAMTACLEGRGYTVK
jgi:hypothetical protein